MDAQQGAFRDGTNRRMSSLRGFLLGGCLLVGTPAALAAAPAPVGVDHHVHLFGPEMRRYLDDYCASPGRLSPCPDSFARPPPTESLVAQMEAAGIAHAVVMSAAYLAESPLMVPPLPRPAELMHEANAFIVGLARSDPGRYSAYISVNPLTASALPEMERWRGDPAVSGLKLHFTNSGVDLRDPAHVAALSRVFAEAARNGWAIAAHIRTRQPDYGSEDVAVFVRDVLPEARGVPVQIAHAGGWGGVDEPALAALEAFADLLPGAGEAGRRLYLELAAVPMGADTPADSLSRLRDLIRRIGVSRFLPGSDWPFVEDLQAYYGTLYPTVPLDDGEWDAIRRNTYLQLRPGD